MSKHPPSGRRPHDGKPPRREPSKRGPKEERLVIRDIQAAIDATWKAKPKKK